MEHKVILVKATWLDRSDYDEIKKLLEPISEWETVDEETFKALKQYEPYGSFILVERLEKLTFETTVAEALKQARAKAAKQKAAEEKRKKTQEERETKALERKLAKAKKLLEEHQNGKT